MRLSKLVQGIKGEILYDGDWEREIVTLSTYSKDKTVSSLFVCLQGQKDGHEYAEEAVKNGAVAIVTEKKLSVEVPQILVEDTRESLALLSSVFYGEPSISLQVIGITGTNGKTTTSYMLSSILATAGKRVGVIGTLGVRYAGQEYPCDLTTPDPIFLQKTLRDMLDCGIEYVVMEVSAHALYYKKVAGVRFCACIASNVTQDHLDFFPNMEAYAQAKSRLFSCEVCPIAVLNADDEYVLQWIKEREKQGGKTITYGLKNPADAFAVVLEESLQGVQCVCNVLDEMVGINLSFLGEYNVYNALSAVACALSLGIDKESICKAFTCLKGVDGRLQRVASWQGGEVFVDFAHTPDGLKQSLTALKGHCKGRLVCVFGCGGNRDKSKRPVMGETVATFADFAVITADNPRFEDPLDIIADIERGYRERSKKYVVIPKRDVAIEYAMERLERGDILLVAGKGGEKTQEIMGIKYPFEDNAIIERFVVQRTAKRFS
ncbi:MAG: UDP-N-acetylmuramoyl-L-alanyl-D-glutamate--2,6-diaminopimelate ligase [Clostridia bacterium]|nr:UDP-N-acetylmuramoyl-L-alanyl-D-glutamate--2,6-diaminopimelate ligase [Clostridia bacterium]